MGDLKDMTRDQFIEMIEGLQEKVKALEEGSPKIDALEAEIQGFKKQLAEKHEKKKGFLASLFDE